MARTRSFAALPIAYVTLRILIILNWLYGAAILGLLTYTFINPEGPFAPSAFRTDSTRH